MIGIGKLLLISSPCCIVTGKVLVGVLYIFCGISPYEAFSLFIFNNLLIHSSAFFILIVFLSSVSSTIIRTCRLSLKSSEFDCFLFFLGEPFPLIINLQPDIASICFIVLPSGPISCLILTGLVMYNLCVDGKMGPRSAGRYIPSCSSRSLLCRLFIKTFILLFSIFIV